MFRLLRYFSIASAAALLAVALALAMLYRHTALNQLIRDTEHQSVFLTRSIANGIWPRFAAHVLTASHTAPDSLVDDPSTRLLREALTPLMQGLPILKVKIYDIGGLTVYSTDPAQIGEPVSDNPDFIALAARGEPATELNYGKTLQAISGPVENRTVVESYLPIRGASGAVDGIFEIYFDVTGQISEVESATRTLLFGLLGLFALLYAGLLFVVRRAERIIVVQYDNIEQKHQMLTQEIDRRGKVEAALRLARDDAEAASRAKSQFLANMSHELRTPLNAVIGFSEVIADEVLGPVAPPRYREYADDIRNSGRHLLGMVSNVLDLAKVEAGRMEVACGPVDLAELARSAARTVEAQCKANGNSLAVDCQPGLQPMFSDEGMIRAILINLLDNAAKFTRDGNIMLTVRQGGTGDKKQTVFEVRDNGIGIDGGRIEEMFGEFVQGDYSMTKIHGGSGLGLAISRRFAETLGGGLTMTSAPGRGTTVTLRLPDILRKPDRETDGHGLNEPLAAAE